MTSKAYVASVKKTAIESKSTRNSAYHARRGLPFLATLIFLLLIACLSITSYAETEIVEVGIPAEENPELFMTRSMPTHGEGKIAVFLIDFPDYRNENPVATAEYYDSLYFSGGINTSWGYDMTVARFYEEESYGKLKLSGRVFDWYTAKHERSYYDGRKAELVMEAAEYYIAQGVDFSQFDGDGDGVIDAIVYHFAGEATEERNTPWYPGLCMYYGGEIGDLKFINMVQVDEDADAASTDMIRTVCHELGHTLGMPDLYGEVWFGMNPTSDLMSTNQRTFNPYTKLLLGWIEQVEVITDDAENVRLDRCGPEYSGDVAIVTTEYNGLFDEFFLVAYRKEKNVGYAVPVVWRIDARLNETGTAFRFQNLYYNPRPDKHNPHDTGYSSPYLFIEELSHNPEFNFVIDTGGYINALYITEDSALGPNGFPSSDTHDGGYTGICVNHFVEHGGQYLTFDVSFVEDVEAPILTTLESDLQFKETITLRFNEYVYPGSNWDNIFVTDMNGDPIEATILLPHYPRHEMEITFKDDSYKYGYVITFPNGAVQDSSGNAINEVTLTASAEKYLFPIQIQQLPGSGEYTRDNGRAWFFSKEDHLLVITGMWEYDSLLSRNIADAQIEFMKLDENGNVLSQIFVENPCDKSSIGSVFETSDGNYIFFCHANLWGGERANWSNLLFCLDAEGNLKWINDDYVPSEIEFHFKNSQVLTREDGLIFIMEDRQKYTQAYAFVDSQTGQIEMAEVNTNGQVKNLFDYVGQMELRDLSNGKFFQFDGRSYRIYNAETFEIEKQAVASDLSRGYTARYVKANDDGTIIVYFDNWEGGIILLLDMDLKVIQSVTSEMRDNSYDAFTNNFWFGNDGFCEIMRVEEGNHSNTGYHVRHFDHSLNLIWEADVDANFIYYFKSSTGELMAYKSMWSPERECYVEYYGHFHTLVHTEAIPSTCISEGCAEYWSCTDCGCRYSDEGQTLVVDIKTLVLPLGGHAEEVIPAADATCTETGLTEGKKCSVCDEILVAQETVDALGHTEEVIPAVDATCNETGLTEGKKCSVCGEILVAQEEIPATGHPEHLIEVFLGKEATCTETGMTAGEKCSACGETLVAQEEIPATGHTEETVAGKAATCTETGLTEGKKCSVCGETTVAQETVATLGHTLGDWVVDVNPAPGVEGSKHKACVVCREVLETAVIEALPDETVSTTETEVESDTENRIDNETETYKDTDNGEDDDANSNRGCLGSIASVNILLWMTLVLSAVALCRKKDNE